MMVAMKDLAARKVWGKAVIRLEDEGEEEKENEGEEIRKIG